MLFAGLLIAAGAAMPAVAQATGWTFETPKPASAHKRKAPPVTPALPPDYAARAAHNAELREEFFAKQAAPPKRGPVPEFGGYDAKTMSGDGQTGMGFKF